MCVNKSADINTNNIIAPLVLMSALLLTYGNVRYGKQHKKKLLEAQQEENTPADNTTSIDVIAIEPPPGQVTPDHPIK